MGGICAYDGVANAQMAKQSTERQNMCRIRICFILELMSTSEPTTHVLKRRGTDQLTSFCSVHEVIEQSDAIRFRPHANLAGILERVIVPFDGFLPIKSDGEMIVLKIDAQCVPLIG